MTADLFVQYATWLLFVAIFVASLIEAVRRPHRANVDVSLAFGAPTAIILIGVAAALGMVTPGQLTNSVNTSLLLAIPFLLLRLVDDFAVVSKILMGAMASSLALLVVTTFLLAPPRPAWHTLLAVGYFVGLLGYVTYCFARESRGTAGVTRRRVQAAAIGSVSLAFAVLATIATTSLSLGMWGSRLFESLALISGVSYFVAFATPRWLRHAWQEPELRSFLRKTADLARTSDLQAVLRELEEGAAASIGAQNARIGLWDESRQVLRFGSDERAIDVPVGEATTASVAFKTQRAAISPRIPENRTPFTELRRQSGAEAALAAPVTAGERRLGVLVVYASRAPVFAGDDLELLQLLAGQAAAVLDANRLIREAAEVRAREELARLREEFLAAAAHDLKTPLTGILGHAQLIQRRMAQDSGAPVDPQSIERIVREARRMTKLIKELLDASRAEQGGLLAERRAVDLVRLAEEVCVGEGDDSTRCSVTATSPVVGVYDRARINQLLGNLVSNALKYSPSGEEVSIRVWQDSGEARIAVEDKGIGIPQEDLPQIFERFQRGSNASDRHFAGLGLGLYISRRIVEEHGGRIWADSAPGEGSVFHVALPLDSYPDRDGKEIEPPV